METTQLAASRAGRRCSACWRWRAACIASHLAKRYGLQFVDETHGGQAVHYGWPRRSVGVELSWKHNTWFAGWELWPNTASQTATHTAEE